MEDHRKCKPPIMKGSRSCGPARRSRKRRRHRIRLPADAPAQSCSLHVPFAKYGLHLPLNRQSVVYGREGIDLDVSTLADWVGAAAATLMPLTEAIRAHVSRGNRGPL